MKESRQKEKHQKRKSYMKRLQGRKDLEPWRNGGKGCTGEPGKRARGAGGGVGLVDRVRAAGLQG